MFCVCKKSRVAQGRLLDNQAKFVIIYHKSTNHLKKFIGKDISRFKKLLLDYWFYRIRYSTFIQLQNMHNITDQPISRKQDNEMIGYKGKSY